MEAAAETPYKFCIVIYLSVCSYGVVFMQDWTSQKFNALLFP